jgi:23S rRNA (cytidine1920-2'-O)/16S rRNA (cytidine1409-2'-O)-methyltransferase
MRLDILLAEKKLVRSRKTASDLIKAGKVLANGEIIRKPAKDFTEEATIKILEQPKYVSRGGLKLEKALTEFQLDPTGLTILDVGSSTGGFTDCLLQKGAKKVYAVDVGADQFDPELKKDSRIILREKTDIRDITRLPEKPDWAVIDASFISLKEILPPVKNLIKETGLIIALVKPQFETPQEAKNKSGIVKTEQFRTEALNKIKDFAKSIGLKNLKTIGSPILGGSGNKEYLLLLQK